MRLGLGCCGSAKIFKVVISSDESRNDREDLMECRVDQMLAEVDVWDGDRFVLKVDDETEASQEDD